MRLLKLANPELQCFECSLHTTPGVTLTQVVDHIGTLTNLTRLELHAFIYEQTINVRPLHSLPLRELVLLDCQNLEAKLLMPGSLTSLQKLHIAESDERQTAISQQPDVMPQLRECGKAVLSLPDLTQLSGSCALFSFGMVEDLSSWQHSAYTKGLMTTNDGDVPDGLGIWIRPTS